MPTLVNGQPQPSYMVIPRSEFFDAFILRHKGMMTLNDATETLTQIVEILSDGGPAAVQAINFDGFPDLNRMRNREWVTNPEFERNWREATKALTNALMAYIYALNLLDTNQRFEYLVTRVTYDLIILSCFPF